MTGLCCCTSCGISMPVFQGLWGCRSLERRASCSYGVLSGEDLKCLLRAVVFAYLDLCESAKITRCFFDETRPSAIPDLLYVLELLPFFWLENRWVDFH